MMTNTYRGPVKSINRILTAPQDSMSDRSGSCLSAGSGLLLVSGRLSLPPLEFLRVGSHRNELRDGDGRGSGRDWLRGRNCVGSDESGLCGGGPSVGSGLAILRYSSPSGFRIGGLTFLSGMAAGVTGGAPRAARRKTDLSNLRGS
jgi:hypothetical protein